MFLEHVEMVTSNLEQTFAHIQGLEFDAQSIFVPINYIIIQMYNKIENENMKQSVSFFIIKWTSVDVVYFSGH